MPRNHFVYKDKEVKRFNHVTVVEGIASIKESTIRELDRSINTLEELDWKLNYKQLPIGRSKCAPEDTFDEKTGLIVASRKAELKALKRYLYTITELRREAEHLLELAKDIEDKLDYKAGKLSLDLVRINRSKQ